MTRGLLVLLAVLMLLAVWMVFVYAPAAAGMTVAQRIFYFHVPAAFAGFAAVFVMLGASIAYLWTRNLKWDNLSIAATESAFLFCALVLLTGPIWAMAAWGSQPGQIRAWIQDPKMLTTLVLWLLLAGCLMVRQLAGNRELRARLAAIVSIVAGVDVYIVHKATVWWRGQHPVVFEPGKGGALAPKMLHTFSVGMIVFFLLFAFFALLRYRIAAIEDRAQTVSEQLARTRGRQGVES